MLFRIGDNVAMTCKNPNETLLFINRVPTAWLFSIDIEICQKVKRMIVEEQNLKDIKIEYEVNGNVKSISLCTRKVSEMMIEDFMLKANETVATFARSLQLIFNYRVHPSPDPEIIRQKIEYINSLGFNIKFKSFVYTSL